MSSLDNESRSDDSVIYRLTHFCPLIGNENRQRGCKSPPTVTLSTRPISAVLIVNKRS